MYQKGDSLVHASQPKTSHYLSDIKLPTISLSMMIGLSFQYPLSAVSLLIIDISNLVVV